MAKPKKDDVGITIRSASVAAAKSKNSELPFHILFVSDLTPGVRRDSSAASSVAALDKHIFPEFMQQLTPRLNIDVAGQVGGSPKSWEIDLRFPDLKAFRPEGIVAQVPALARLLQVRQLVGRVREGKLPVSKFKAAAEAAGLDPDIAERFEQVLAAPPASPQSPSPGKPSEGKQPQETGKLSSLLDLVDLGESAPGEKKPDAMDALMSAIGADEGATPDGSLVDRSASIMLIEELDRMLCDQVNSILHHPQFSSLESSWRSLKFLVDRIDFRENIRLSVLAARKADLNNALASLEQPSAGPPISVVIADYEFGSITNEVEQLDDLADTMASLQAPLLAGVGPAFFGRRDASEISALPVLWQHFERPEYVSWNALRERAASRYLTLALPHFLLRTPYGSENPVKEFRCVESDGSASLCRGNAAVAVAATLAQSFMETGWPTRITGSAGGRVENLALFEEAAGRAKVRTPLDATISDDRQVELSEMGFTVLACKPNHDAAYVAFAPTIHRPEKYDDPDSNEDARMHATLSCQLMTTRIAHHLLFFERTMTPGLSVAGALDELTFSLRTLLRVGDTLLPGSKIEVERVVGDDVSSSDRVPLRIRIVSPPEILGREASIVMGFELLRR